MIRPRRVVAPEGLTGMEEDHLRDASSEPGGAKKPYAAPTLVVYGTLTAITQAVGRRGSPDGGRGGRRRSQP